MAKVLQQYPFPICCGIEVLTCWGWSRTHPHAEGEHDLNDIEDDLRDIEEAKHVGLRLVALSEDQIPHVEYLLEKFNYKPLVKDFYHTGHRKTITLYGKVIHPDQSKYQIGEVPFHGKDERVNHETPRKVAPKPEAPKVAKKTRLDPATVNFPHWDAAFGTQVARPAPVRRTATRSTVRRGT